MSQPLKEQAERLAETIMHHTVCAACGCCNPNHSIQPENFYPCTRCKRDAFSGETFEDWLASNPSERHQEQNDQ